MAEDCQSARHIHPREGRETFEPLATKRCWVLPVVPCSVGSVGFPRFWALMLATACEFATHLSARDIRKLSDGRHGFGGRWTCT